MQFEAVKDEVERRRGETVNNAVRRLKEAILLGRLVPGQRLVVKDLTDEYSVSRSTVREAFRLLSGDGLVELVPNRGAIVCRLTRKQIADLFQIRVYLEGLAARLAAENINRKGHRESFLKVWGTMRAIDASHSWHLFIQQNRIYHLTIVSLGENERLSELIDNLQLPVVMFQVGQAMRPDHVERSQRDHVRVAEAILNGDPDAAERAMRAHVEGSADWISGLPDSAFKPTRGDGG